MVRRDAMRLLAVSLYTPHCGVAASNQYETLAKLCGSLCEAIRRLPEHPGDIQAVRTSEMALVREMERLGVPAVSHQGYLIMMPTTLGRDADGEGLRCLTVADSLLTIWSW